MMPTTQPHQPHRRDRTRPAPRDPARPSRRAVMAAAVAAMLVAAACTSSEPDGNAPTMSRIDAAGTSAEPGNDTDRPPEQRDPDRDASPEPADDGPSDREQVDQLWSEFMATWLEQAAEDTPDVDAFADLAVDPDALVDALVAQRGEARTVTVDHELWSSISAAARDATIDDCVIAAQHPVGRPGSEATITTRWAATAIPTDDGWRLENVAATGTFCIASELNDRLLTAYRDYRVAKDSAWDPPDPEHPALARTMTGAHLEFVQELLREHEREGIVVRDPAPTHNAVVWSVEIGHATVSDCAEQTPERGAFEVATGERLDELIPPVRDGQRDAQSVDLVRTATGEWKVENQAGTRDTDCIEGDTRYAVE